MSEESLRQQIAQWWQDRIEGVEDFSLAELASEGAAHFRQDPEFCERFLDEWLRPTVYQVGMSLLSQERAAVLRDVARPATVPTRRVAAAGVAAAIEEKPADWSRWLERDPDTGKYVPLFLLTKEQALRAAEAREQRADPDLRRAGLLRMAAGRLGKGQRIENVWTAGQLAEIERTLAIGRPKYSLGKGTIYDLIQRGAA